MSWPFHFKVYTLSNLDAFLISLSKIFVLQNKVLMLNGHMKAWKCRCFIMIIETRSLDWYKHVMKKDGGRVPMDYKIPVIYRCLLAHKIISTYGYNTYLFTGGDLTKSALKTGRIKTSTACLNRKIKAWIRHRINTV